MSPPPSAPLPSTSPGALIRAEQGEILLRANTLAKDREALGEIVLLATPEGAILRLRDVATIIDGFTPDPLLTRFNGKPAAMIRVFEVGDQNPLEISRQIRSYVAEQKLRMPEGVEIDVWRDFSIYLRDRLNLLINNGIIGFLLVLLVLTLFLRPMLALFVSIGIPISFLATIFVMPSLGLTINLVTLFGFILVLGIVVDDAIVVGESVFSEFQKAGPGVDSAIRGTNRVAIPVTFAVLTTVVAFAPIFFVPGTFGKLFFGIPAVVIPTLLFSLVQSKLVLPYHLSLCRVGQRDRDEIGGLRRLQLTVADSLERFVDRVYRPVLAWALSWRYLTVALFVATLSLAVGIVGSGWVRSIFLSPVPSDYVVALLNMPEGAPYQMTRANTERLAGALEEVRAELAEEGIADPVRHLSITLGGAQFQGGGPGGSRDSSSNTGQGEISLELVDPDIREISAPDLADRWRDKVGQLPGVRDLTFQAEAANPAGNAINIQLTGPDFDTLTAAGDRIKEKLRSYAGIFDVRDSYSAGKDEINLRILPSARAAGFSQIDLARQVRGAFFGDEVQRIQRGRDEIKIMVRYPEAERDSLAALENLWIRNGAGEPMPIRSAARLEMGEGFAEITRIDRRRAVNVFADADDAVVNVDDALADLRETTLPGLRGEFPSVNVSFEGESREQRDIRASMARGAVLAALVIYALLAIPFRSYLQPLIVMSVIPFGIVGAIGGHWITGQDFSILSLLGLVALSGVVVNDSLVLVDYINQQVREGKPLLAAVRESGARRFRPVLLTSLTTFVGLIPILLETNLQAQFLIPMATSLAFGILFATLITLFLVPAIYLSLEDVKKLFQENRRTRFADQRDRAVLHFRGGIPFGVDIGDLLQLEGSLEREGEHELPPEEKTVFVVRVAGGDFRDVIVEFEGFPHEPGQISEGLDETHPVAEAEVPQPPEIEGNHGHQDELRSERLGRGDPDLRPGVLVDAPVGLPGDGRADHIVDRQRAVALPLGLAERGERVDRLTGLADHEDEGVLVEGGVPVAEFGGVLHLDGNPGILFDQVLGHQAGMPGRAAPTENNPLHLAEFPRGDVQAAELGGAAVLREPSPHGVFQGLRLLEDFLEHEVPEVAEFGILHRPIDPVDHGLDRLFVGRDHLVAVAGEFDQLAVVEVDDVQGRSDKGSHVAGDEVFVLAQADDERGTEARADQQIREVRADHGDPVGALDVEQRLAHTPQETVVAPPRPGPPCRSDRRSG